VYVGNLEEREEEREFERAEIKKATNTKRQREGTEAVSRLVKSLASQSTASLGPRTRNQEISLERYSSSRNTWPLKDTADPRYTPRQGDVGEEGESLQPNQAQDNAEQVA
jgi:hypothetical protein